MSKYQAYPEYKYSGVEWLGEVPKHWKVKKIKHFGRVIGGFAFKSGDFIKQGYPVIKITNVSHLKMSFDDEAYLPEKFAHENAEYIAPLNSLVFAMTRPIIAGGIKVAKMPKLERMPLINQRVGFLKVEDEDLTDYILFSSLSNSFIAQFKNNMTITNQPNISSEGIESVSFPFPPEEELRQIVAFLDHEIARIDTLINKQQQLIKLLIEKRQAVISHAVTKGFNPHAPMKDSGVEWLGEVPSHWDVTKFGYISQVVRGGSPRPAGDPTLFDGDYSPWVTVAEITKDDEIYLSETETFLTKKGSEQCRVFTSGTLLLSNSGATLGVPKILSINANANDGVVGFENLTLNSEFAYFYLSTLTHDLRERIKQGSGQPNLNTDIVKNIFVPIPASPEETDTIVSYIKSMCEKFDALALKAKNAISLMQERRTALISAAVTGKIDVRNWNDEEKGNEEKKSDAIQI
ncbi:restriction endonuclease subunit S [Vibrio sp. JZG120]